MDRLNNAKEIISDQIRGEWEAIRNYNKAAKDLEDIDMSRFGDVMDLLNDIADEEEVHVGELQKAQSLIDNNVLDNIDDGEKEAEEKLMADEEINAKDEEPVEEALQLKESSITFDSVDLPGKKYLECRWDKYNGYEVVGGYYVGDGLVSGSFHKSYPTKEAAIKAYERYKKQGGVDESLKEEVQTDQLTEIDSYIDDIYNLRKESLNNDGEYGIGNLVFKEIRNKGYLDNLKDLKNEVIGKELSLESLEEDTEKVKKGKWVNRGKQGTHGTFRTKKAADAQRKAMFANGYSEDLQEATLNYGDQYAKMSAWHNGYRGANIKSMSDDKLKMNYNICKKEGWAREADELFREGKYRGLPWATTPPAPTTNSNYTNTQYLMDIAKKLDWDDVHQADGQFVKDNQSNTYELCRNFGNVPDTIEVRFVYLIWAMTLGYPKVIGDIKDSIVNDFGIPVSELKKAVQIILNNQDIIDRLDQGIQALK